MISLLIFVEMTKVPRRTDLDIEAPLQVKRNIHFKKSGLQVMNYSCAVRQKTLIRIYNGCSRKKKMVQDVFDIYACGCGTFSA